MPNDRSLRDYLAELLDWGNAHIKFEDAVKDFPAGLRGKRPNGAPHSAWELLEHLRLALWDIYEFSVDASHVSPSFPDGYWPATPEPPSEAAWDESVSAYRATLRKFAALVSDESGALSEKTPQGGGQRVLRGGLLGADHNGYPLGQLVMVRRMLE